MDRLGSYITGSNPFMDVKKFANGISDDLAKSSSLRLKYKRGTASEFMAGIHGADTVLGGTNIVTDSMWSKLKAKWSRLKLGKD
jgi:hypothetical protein